MIEAGLSVVTALVILEQQYNNMLTPASACHSGRTSEAGSGLKCLLSAIP